MTAAFGAADFTAIRAGLSALPRAENHAPDAPVDPKHIQIVPGHGAALDFNRELVVGNRGMGKSFWAHALADPAARAELAKGFAELSATEVCIGFNASERSHPIAPIPRALQDTLSLLGDPDVLWRAVLVRVANHYKVVEPMGVRLPDNFSEVVSWVRAHGELADRVLTAMDDQFIAERRKLVVVFDALDRLGSDWQTTSKLTAALLKRALAARSYRAIRLKLFMRRDQFEDPALFEFPDGSKIRNTRVELKWSPSDLYALLFARLSQAPASTEAFARLRSAVSAGNGFVPRFDPLDGHKALVDAIAGEYMGADKKRGRVYTWLPLHLSDARGETSPRTFLTAWREAAVHLPPPRDRAVDHAGLLEGVRKASEDRLQELREDYWWIDAALSPLRGQMVPMERSVLESLWQASDTAETIRKQSKTKGLAPIQLEDTTKAPEHATLDALSAIGIVEIRPNGKINVPDIFRVEAGIKRKGGVKPPQRSPAER